MNLEIVEPPLELTVKLFYLIEKQFTKFVIVIVVVVGQVDRIVPRVTFNELPLSNTVGVPDIVPQVAYNETTLDAENQG